MGVYDVPIQELIERSAEELKKISEIKPPSWASFVKTGMHKERPPVREDWWHIRAASMLRKLMILGPIGVSKLRVKYGGAKKRGDAPERFRKSSGNILRKILQQLEKSGLAVKAEKGAHKGRIITPKGIALLDRVACQIAKEKGVVIPKRPAEQLKVTNEKAKTKRTAKPKGTTKRRTLKKKEAEETKDGAVTGKKEENAGEAPQELEKAETGDQK